MMHSPERMCVLCRNRFDKSDLYRFVVRDKKVVCDKTGKSNGRGAYLCKNCLLSDKKTRCLAGTLKAEVSEDLWKEPEYCH